MAFRALLVTKDDQAVETLAPVLSDLGLLAQCCGYPDAVCLVTEQKFHVVVVDFDDPHSAALVMQSVASAAFENPPINIVLLNDKSKVRAAFRAGANFIVYKPVTLELAAATLRTVAMLIKRERRHSVRVSVQVPIKLKLESSSPIEGILLDLSEYGMDVLASEPLYCSASLNSRFTLPDWPSEIELHGEVAWANPNGESGVRFTENPESLRTALRRWIFDHMKEPTLEVPEAVPDCKLTDLSLGGCYVETPSPFPERTHLVLSLKAEAAEIQAKGWVRVMHPSRGMGIEFALRSTTERHQTENFIQFLASRPGVQPELLASPANAAENFSAPSDDVEDPLLDLLRNHESFSEEMFLQALRSQRNEQLVQS